MTDLVTRIRTRINDSHMDIERLLDEAADEIERLQKEKQELAIEVHSYLSQLLQPEHWR
jgi:hypothetical protein